ncbi:MAG TPA: hypothetical protein VMS31_02950 [Pyrinomonadaceae bacterium]|nr:hypothetical protein [Pyrinomonadaceae bacterium]
MSDEKNESRINIEDLPQPERELTAEDHQKVQGGATTTVETDADPMRESMETMKKAWKDASSTPEGRTP